MPRMNGKSLLVRATVTTIGIATLLSAAAVVLARWEAIAGAAAGVKPGWLVAGFATLALCYGLVAALWYAGVHVLGAALRPAAAFRAFALAQLPKYVPGRVVGHGVRVSAARRAGVPTPVAVASLALEGALGMIGALAVSAGGLLFGIRVTGTAGTRWLLALFVAAVAGGALALLIRWPEGRWREHLGIAGLRGRRVGLLALAAGYTAYWLPLGVANWLLANSVTALPIEHLLPLTVAVAVATGMGQLAVVAPGGIGVREGALYLFARTWMTDPQALLFVSLGRAASIAIEALLSTTGAILSLTGDSGGGTHPEG